ncbi:mitochondrial amidoxime-reducing component 1-like [Drosophila guanche]|uniref:Blast:Mitochondrial amidoxime-reducing component 1 n=2 Tax=Drosophila guanche TaxID=7266 RepID=A0A3B0J6Q9_DROGU|nr:mitochondrial amidoxime-reducing component 1-like [Drosophila guanche]SPP75743.1 blast:Mitochondrial amidoxime-reducing component 1 [Drosophila guanche]
MASSSSSLDIGPKTLIGVGIGLVVAGGASYFLYRRYLQHRDAMPVNWRRVGTLQQINLFPVKSCAPVDLGAGVEYDCDVLGLSYEGIRDRTLMLIDENNTMVTARGYPHMLLIKSRKASVNGIVFSAPGMHDLELDFENLESPGQDLHTSVWGARVDAMLCGERFNKWFSQFILKMETGLKLVHYPYPKAVKIINPRLKNMPDITQADSGAFNDATSYMLMNLSSVADLNTRIKNPVDPLQFRGNFELKADIDEPYAEDHWQWVRIGDKAVFRSVAPCTRCILPNINVNTAERDIDGEPLKTLRSFRLFNYSSPALGIHLGLRQPGRVKANDVVYVGEK